VRTIQSIEVASGTHTIQGVMPEGIRRFLGKLSGDHLRVPMEEPQQWVQVIRQDEFLRATLLKLAGPESRCSLEGTLDRYALPNVVSYEEVGALRRHTLWPKRDFAVLRLDAETANQVVQQLTADPNRAADVEHIQVERQGLLAMGGYDGLDATWVGKSLSRTELDHLVDAGIIELKKID
jgi:hypothetical protein